jgi:type I restriction enzyme S subunit
MKDELQTLMPKLRFPEFTEPWNTIPLKELAVPVSDRVGTSECVPYTVTSGVGLVSQDQKFGRTIAGKSLSNYIRLQKHDFAYNKSATKAFPEGYITRHLDDVRAAVPNSIFTCFRADTKKIDPAYLEFLFAGNLHGRWLRKFLTVGARAHGSLNVNDDDLMALPVPLAQPAEQLKIAACLTSLDDCIASEGRKFEALEAHKRGLMQHLFPHAGESRPRLRFPEFRDAPEWPAKVGGDLFTNRKEDGEEGLPIYSVTVNEGMVPRASFDRNFYDIEEPEGNKKACKGDIAYNMMRMWQGAQGVAVEDCMVSPAYIVLAPLEDVCSEFFGYLFKLPQSLHLLTSHSRGLTKDRLRLYFDDFKRVPLRVPQFAEQQRIAACLSSLDALIAAASRKRDCLRAHKKSLMQQLFPLPEVR